MVDFSWKIAPMQEVIFVECEARTWSKGVGIRYTFEDLDGNQMQDGIWFKHEMTQEYFEDVIKKSRHIVSTIAGRDAWENAGSPAKLGKFKFLQNLAWLCNQHKSDHFYLKTLYSLSSKGEKRVRFGKTVRFISRINAGASLFYSNEERADGRLVLTN